MRRAKTEAKVSQRATVARLDVRGPDAWLAEIEAARADLVDALTVDELDGSSTASTTLDWPPSSSGGADGAARWTDADASDRLSR